MSAITVRLEGCWMMSTLPSAKASAEAELVEGCLGPWLSAIICKNQCSYFGQDE